MASRTHAAADAAGESALPARIRAGDHRAFEALFRAHHALLQAIAGRLASPDLAEEIVQDVMLSLWERRATFHVTGSVRGYLLAAVRFAAASAVRHRQVVSRHAEAVHALYAPAAPADAELLMDERVRAIDAAIERLPDRCRLVFQLVRLEGLSYAEAASALGISPKTVDAQMGNALRRLRDDLRALRR
jgi:RNA polymerase sigma-19 factor, ECF subfamily